jgi:isocitrate dehydrogenase (NAD+)
MIPGDGVGRELCDSVATIFSKACVPVDFEKVEVSGYTEDTNGYRAAIESIKRNKVALKGMFYTPTTKLGHLSFNVAMRKELDIYASVVLVRNLIDAKLDSRIRHPNVDFVVIRENTEGEYSGLEHQSCPGVIESLKVGLMAEKR